MNYTNIDRIGRRLFRYPIYNFLKLFSTTNMPEASDEPIDVIIPIIASVIIRNPPLPTSRNVHAEDFVSDCLSFADV